MGPVVIFLLGGAAALYTKKRLPSVYRGGLDLAARVQVAKERLKRDLRMAHDEVAAEEVVHVQKAQAPGPERKG